MTFPHFIACMATAFVPPWLTNRAFLSGFGAAWPISLGVLAFVVAQLGKNLILATFVPEAAEGVGALALSLRAAVAACDVFAVGLVGLRGLRGGETRVRVLGLAVGWTTGENVFRKFFFFWSGLWQNEFSWSYMCSALDSNGTLLLSIVLMHVVDQYWYPSKRSGGKDPQQALYQAIALVALLPMLLALLGEWTAVAVKLGLGLVLAHWACKDLAVY